ncbi:MAG: 16S rRNA (cytosine(1402)-N(4))-methyltransferase RsmH [Phycisphaerales bacterium]|nr:16S rRNA (cytosine(1402)-N(4))-methyltransferase RsmH [Phycisphaerales bacterium]
MQRDGIEHEPVLCGPVLSLLDPRPGETVVDATLGHGGHARLMAEAIGPTGRLIGFDVDEQNIERARRRLEHMVPPDRRPSISLLRANFHELNEQLDLLGVAQVDVVLADLGPSTDQLLDTELGLSFSADGPLDMRLDSRLSTTAADLVNAMGENDLADLFYNLSQERFSRRIARRICKVRHEGRIWRTSELVRIICSAVGEPAHSRAGRIHPATRVFLALRMAVNHEVENLQSLLGLLPDRLRSGGRAGIISFHSGEDRLVKQDFLARKASGLYEIRTKKPMTPSREECASNPRSRSAKLRVAARLPAG